MREDWKDDVFENARKYKMVNNDDGTVSLEDSTTYTQQGDSFGAKELNEIGKEINDLTNEMKETKKSVSDGKTLIAAAITLKRVATAATDTFAVMAEKIRQIVLGSGNATTGDVLKGKTFTNDDGVEYTGTLEDKSNTKQEVTASLDTTNKRVQMVAPATGKYTNGTSVLYTTYAKLASLIGLTAAKLWPGITILGITSSKSSMTGGTIKPGTSQQTISCNGKAMTSNVVVAACSLPAAANLKKGVTYTLPSGEKVTGTWEGYVAAATDLYYRGTNNAGFAHSNSGDYSKITWYDTYLYWYGHFNNGMKLSCTKSYNFSGYTKLNVLWKCSRAWTSSSYGAIVFGVTSPNSFTSKLELNNHSADTEYTSSVDITDFETTATSWYMTIEGSNVSGSYGSFYIYRIWLS